jgi:hypothetical protein
MSSKEKGKFYSKKIESVTISFSSTDTPDVIAKVKGAESVGGGLFGFLRKKE